MTEATLDVLAELVLAGGPMPTDRLAAECGMPLLQAARRAQGLAVAGLARRVAPATYEATPTGVARMAQEVSA